MHSFLCQNEIPILLTRRTFHKIAIKYDSDLKNSVRYVRYFYEL